MTAKDVDAREAEYQQQPAPAMGAEDIDEEEEEYRRQKWIKYYVEIHEYAAARSLGWDDQPFDDDTASAPATTQARTLDEDQAATAIQARYKAFSRRQRYKDERDEAARLQWIEYYVATKQYDAAREYGWDGAVPSTETEKAATLVQKHYRGFRQREDFKDVRDEEARQQWVAYYVRTGQIDQAKALGYQEPHSMPVLNMQRARAVARPNDGPKYATCYQSFTAMLTPRSVREKSEKKMNSVLMLQRCARGMLARARMRLIKREALLIELVNRQEERHAKRIEYYINLFLVNRERNATFHSKARAIQAGYRGKQARGLRRKKEAAREEERRRKAQEEEEKKKAEQRRAEEEARARQPGGGVSFAQSNARAGREESGPRRPEIRDGMTAHEITEELARSARVSAQQASGRTSDLTRRVMQETRGNLKKKSPHSRLRMSHTRYFYFETDKLCWRKVGEDEDEDGPRKFIAMSDITNVEVLEPVGKFEFAVSLRREAKPYQLRAASMNDLQRWVSTLKIIQAVKEIESQSARR